MADETESDDGEGGATVPRADGSDEPRPDGPTGQSTEAPDGSDEPPERDQDHEPAADDEAERVQMPNRVTLETRVTPTQRDIWEEHAERAGLDIASFIRTMVEAGRVEFALPSFGDEQTGNAGAVDGESSDVELSDEIVALLRREEFLTRDDLLRRLTADVQEGIDAALDELQLENRVKHDGRHGGYTLTGDE